jgi:hypothetical protein
MICKSKIEEKNNTSHERWWNASEEDINEKVEISNLKTMETAIV